ncbi:hypothetical protein XH96_26755 [Bradyrhizobium sp. CCBAU 51765]|nr:hypothetical protein XH96_26755 [Bradyrhizobium sp. CCBAU 51765]
MLTSLLRRAIAFESFPRGHPSRRPLEAGSSGRGRSARQQFQRALTPMSLILRRRMSAVSKDEAFAQAATSHMR